MEDHGVKPRALYHACDLLFRCLVVAVHDKNVVRQDLRLKFAGAKRSIIYRKNVSKFFLKISDRFP